MPTGGLGPDCVELHVVEGGSIELLPDQHDQRGGASLTIGSLAVGQIHESMTQLLSKSHPEILVKLAKKVQCVDFFFKGNCRRGSDIT